jgi:hypothetical protein
MDIQSHDRLKVLRLGVKGAAPISGNANEHASLGIWYFFADTVNLEDAISLVNAVVSEHSPSAMRKVLDFQCHTVSWRDLFPIPLANFLSLIQWAF